MCTPQHPRFGRLAQALDARVVDANESAVTLIMRPEALEDSDRRWLREQAGDGAFDGQAANSWTLQLPAAALAATGGEGQLRPLLRAAHQAWSAPIAPPAIMAILNVTPDSFSDGGQYLEPARAIEAGLRFAAEGAAWIDVGGESTRPGAAEISVEQECARVLPVIAGLAREGLERISIDTRHGQVARAALEAGAQMVNDVGAGLDDPEMLEVVRRAGCEYVLMHRQGNPADMQNAPNYADVVGQVSRFLRARVAACLEAGIDSERLLIDPGIGFGKRLEHNLALFKRLGELRSLGIGLLVGPSRKSFIGHITGSQEEADWARSKTHDNPLARIGGTAAAISFCVAGGVKVLRVHDVAIMSEACTVAAAIHASPASPDPLPC